MSRKYSTYRIHVVYKGGEEDIVLNDISSSNYKETLATYNEIKETLQDKGAIKIEFQGITKDGEIGILFTKECELIEDTEDTEDIEEIEEIRGFNEIFKDMHTLAVELKTKYKHDTEIMDFKTKELDMYAHMIEDFDETSFETDEEAILEKVRIFNEFNRLRNERRDIKNNDKYINHIVKTFGIKRSEALDKLINGFKFETSKNKYKGLTEKKAETYKIFKKVHFKNDVERVKLEKRLKPQFEKVMIDKETNTILCYNKAKAV